MSKNIKTTALVLVLLLAFLCGFMLGKDRGFNLNFNNNPYGTTAPADTKDAEPVDATTEPADDTADTQPDKEKPAKKLTVPKGAEAVVSAYNKAVNAAKRSEDITIKQTVALQMEPTDVSPYLAKGAAQSAIKRAVRPLDMTYTIRSDGKKADKTAKEILAPAAKASKLSPDNVTAAKAKAKDGGYVIVIKLKPETAVYKNEKVKQAKAHSTCLTMPDPSAMTAFGVKTKTAAVKYTETTIRATIDSSGKLAKVQYTLPFTAKLTGKFYLMNMTAAIDGTITETVELSA